MIYIIGFVLFSIFVLLSALHLYWGLGGKWGFDVSIPSKENGKKIMEPTVVDCFAIAVGLLACGLFILAKSQLLPFNLPIWMPHYGTWIISAIFLLRAIGEFKYVGFFKRIKSTAFGRQDTRYYSPLCLVIGLLAMILAFAA